MTEDNFGTNLLRLVAAELYFSLGMQAAREMFGKGYFSLGMPEKQAVDSAVLATVQANYQSMTADLLQQWTAPAIAKPQAPKPPVGFQHQNQTPRTDS